MKINQYLCHRLQDCCEQHVKAHVSRLRSLTGGFFVCNGSDTIYKSDSSQCVRLNLALTERQHLVSSAFVAVALFLCLSFNIHKTCKQPSVMCTQIIEGDLKEEILKNATQDVLQFFNHEFSYGEMQSVVLKGINTAMFYVQPEDPCIADDLAEMLQTINFALKLLRPFAAVCGQIENDYYFKHR